MKTAQHTPEKIAYSYIRWSSPQQSWGDSERRQNQLAQDTAKRLGLTLSETFADKGVSADKGKNLEKSFAALLKVLKSGDYLLIEDQDRITRQDPLVLLNYLKMIVEKGVIVVTCRDGQQITKDNFFDAGVFILNAMKGVLSTQENTKRKFRLKEKWAGRKEQMRIGNFVKSPSLPVWLMNGNGCYEVKKGSKRIIEKLFSIYNGGKGCHSVAGELNKIGVPVITINKNGNVRKNSKGWNGSQVHNVLINKACIGLNEMVDPPVRMFPRMIDDKTFYTANSKLVDRKTFTGRTGDDVSIFSGLIKCKCCGYSIIRHSSADNVSMRCSNAHQRMAPTGNCDMKIINLELFEFSFFETMLQEDKFLRSLMKDESTDRSVEELKGKLVVTQKRLDRYTADYTESPSNVLATLLKQTEGLVAHLQREYDKALAKRTTAVPLLENYDLIQDEYAENYKNPLHRIKIREVLRSVIDRIEMNIPDRYYDIHLKGVATPIHIQLDPKRQYGYTVNGNHYDAVV